MIGTANAEMIPQTPTAQQAVDLGLKAGGQNGAIIRQLNSLPDKVYVTDKPDIFFKASELSTKNGLDGLFRPDALDSGYTISLKPGMPLGQQIATLAHESGHGVAQIAGVGGYNPTGIGVVDMLANNWRLPNKVNENLADSLAGFDNRKNELADKVRQIMTKKVK